MSMGYTDVFIVDEKRMREVVRVLAERLSVITLGDEKRLVHPGRRARRPADQLPKCGVSIVQCVEVAPEVARRSNGPESGAT